MTTNTTFHIDSDATDSPLETYLPKRRRDVEPDVPSQAAEALPLLPEPASAPAPVTAPMASAPDDEKEKLFADYLSIRNKQIKAAAAAYEYQLRAYYERRDFFVASYTARSEEQTALAAECEANADALRAQLEEWPA